MESGEARRVGAPPVMPMRIFSVARSAGIFPMGMRVYRVLSAPDKIA